MALFLPGTALRALLDACTVHVTGAQLDEQNYQKGATIDTYAQKTSTHSHKCSGKYYTTEEMSELMSHMFC